MGEHAVPILPSRDLRETLAFYERLGFENRRAEPEEWDYLIVGRGGIVLHFFLQPDVDPLSTAAGCYVHVDDATHLAEVVRDYASRIVVHASAGSRTTLEVIAELVGQAEQRTGQPPLVVVDYLQKVRGLDPRRSEDEQIALVVEGLKDLALERELPVLAVSPRTSRRWRRASGCG